MRPLSASVPIPKNEAILKSKRNEIRELFVKGSSRGAMMATLGETFGLDQVNSVALVNDA